MIQIVLKNEIEQSKIDALLIILKSWGIDTELKVIDSLNTKKESVFSLSEGIWKDYQINAEDIRNKAWNQK